MTTTRIEDPLPLLAMLAIMTAGPQLQRLRHPAERKRREGLLTGLERQCQELKVIAAARLITISAVISVVGG